MIEKILKLKKEKNAVILAHSYQPIEIDEVADFVGDSLYLSQMAAKTNADIIVFAGVYFMAETAKMLSPKKKVLLPKIESGCEMADMINLQKLKDFKAKMPNIPTVCYINTTAEVKSECDYCCTSSNAVNIVNAIESKEILFVPDKNLGAWVQKNIPNKNIHTFNGCCPIHNNITAEDVLQKKSEYPNALVLVHPECNEDVTKLADYIGSTTGIMNFVKNSSNNEFIISTEIGVVERLNRDYPQRKFVLVSPKAICQNMKWHKLEDIYNALLNEEHEIKVEDTIAQKAVECINKMLKISK